MVAPPGPTETIPSRSGQVGQCANALAWLGGSWQATNTNRFFSIVDRSNYVIESSQATLAASVNVGTTLTPIGGGAARRNKSPSMAS
jgi:hypothetical protein